METRASYLVVGGFVLVSLIALVVMVIWLAGTTFDEEFAYYDILFEGSVTGLKSGNPVRYRGIPVGVVSDMGIDKENVERVRVTIEVPNDTPIKEDAITSLEFQGITGVAYVQFEGGGTRTRTCLVHNWADPDRSLSPSHLSCRKYSMQPPRCLRAPLRIGELPEDIV